MLLVGAITAGMHIPSQESLSGFDSGGELDYSAYLSGFAPLSVAFISEVLGLEESPATAAEGSNEGVPEEGAERAVPSGGSDKPSEARTDVEHPFTNDDAATAYDVSSLPFRSRTDTSEGTRSPDEPGDCFPVGGTAWYRYRPRTDVALFSDTFGTSRPTALGVYARTESGGFEPIGCDENVLGNAQVGFPARAGTAYYFQVTSMARGGPTIFELAEVGRTTVVSGAPSGAPPDGPAIDRPDISAEGRYVVFTSLASNLTSLLPDCGSLLCRSVYVRDRVTQQTELISSYPTADPAGTNTFEYSTLFPSLSPDGRYVGFSAPPGPTPGGSEGGPSQYDPAGQENQSFLYDRVTDSLEVVSRNSSGELAAPDSPDSTSDSLGPSVSSGGRYVVFNSRAPNMPGHSDSYALQVYRRDLVTGETRVVSTTPSGDPNHVYSCAATGRNVSGNGRYAVFYSTYGAGSDGGNSANFEQTLVYLWDARTGKSRVVSKVLPGEEVQGSYCPSISLDGSRVGLVSRDALVPGDTNGLPDVYVYDVATKRIQRISETADGKQSHDPNYTGREHGFLHRSVNLSADGRFVVFDSAAPDLAPSSVGSAGHPPETTRVFVHDMLTGATVLVSVSSTGEPLGGNSHTPYISADGSAVAFMNTPIGGLERVMVHELSFVR
jgi:Tol biopolymer transport system component